MSGRDEMLMRGRSWIRVYHAYFQSMVVRGLTNLAYNAVGEDVGFAAVADIIKQGAINGFGVLLEEASKAGIRLEGLSVEKILEYEIRCHRKAVEEMGVPFQAFERIVKLENGYALETSNCIYRQLAEKTL